MITHLTWGIHLRSDTAWPAEVTLYRSSTWRDFVFEVTDWFEAKVLRHHACNSWWYQGIFNWQQRAAVEVSVEPIPIVQTELQAAYPDREDWEDWK